MLRVRWFGRVVRIALRLVLEVQEREKSDRYKIDTPEFQHGNANPICALHVLVEHTHHRYHKTANEE